MVYLNLQIETIIQALDDAGYLPASFYTGGGATATVVASATEPTDNVTGDLWFDTSTAVLRVYNGTAYQQVSLTAAEKSQLASLANSVTLANQAKLGAEEARDTILNMTTSTGDEGTLVSWNSSTGVLTIPKGDTGQSIDHIIRTAGDGSQGTIDTYTVWGDVAETISLGTFTVFNPVSGITDHTLLTSIGTNTHAQIDTHIADATKHFTQAEISITESQISDFGSYEAADEDIVKAPLGVLPALDGSNLTGISGAVDGISVGFQGYAVLDSAGLDILNFPYEGNFALTPKQWVEEQLALKQTAGSITESSITDLGTTVVLDSDIGVTVQGYDANTSKTNVSSLFTAPQRSSWSTAPTGTFLLADSQHFHIAPTTNITIALPTDAAAQGGQCGIILIDASTYTISWATGWFFDGGVAPTLSGICYLAYVSYSDGALAVGSPVVVTP